MEDIPIGLKLYLFPCCCALEKFIATNPDKAKAQKIKKMSKNVCVSWVSSDDTTRAICRRGQNFCLKRMIYPFSKAEEKHSQRDYCYWSSREGFEHPGSSQQKNSDSDNHKDLIPVIKSKFRQRILHKISGLFPKRHNDQGHLRRH